MKMQIPTEDKWPIQKPGIIQAHGHVITFLTFIILRETTAKAAVSKERRSLGQLTLVRVTFDKIVRQG
jgi:hypothetical protein